MTAVPQDIAAREYLVFFEGLDAPVPVTLEVPARRLMIDNFLPAVAKARELNSAFDADAETQYAPFIFRILFEFQVIARALLHPTCRHCGFTFRFWCDYGYEKTRLGVETGFCDVPGDIEILYQVPDHSDYGCEQSQSSM
jgi:hypothetical protein